MRRRNYRLKRSIGSSVHIQLILYFDFSLFMFYFPLDSTLSFALDLRVLPLRVRYLVSINKCRLEFLCSAAEPAGAMVRLDLSRLVIYTAQCTYISPCRACFITEFIVFAFFNLRGAIFILALCFRHPNSCFTANFFHRFFFELASIPLFPLF